MQLKSNKSVVLASTLILLMSQVTCTISGWNLLGMSSVVAMTKNALLWKRSSTEKDDRAFFYMHTIGITVFDIMFLTMRMRNYQVHQNTNQLCASILQEQKKLLKEQQKKKLK